MVLRTAAGLLLACVLASAGHAEQVKTDEPIGSRAPVRAPASVAPAVGLVTKTDANGLVAALLQAGFTAQVKTEGRETYVLGSLGPIPFTAAIDNCTTTSTAGCTDISLEMAVSGGRKMSLERMNGWNARTRLARGFLDEEGDPTLRMDIMLDDGVSPANLKAQLMLWGGAMTTFVKFAAAPANGAEARPAAPSAPPAAKKSGN